MTANRKILPPFQYFCFLFWSSIRGDGSKEDSVVCYFVIILPFFLSVINVGAEISLSGDGEISAPKKKKLIKTNTIFLIIYNHHSSSSPAAAASPLPRPRCTADTRSPRRRKTIWRNIVTVVFASSTPLVLCHSYFCEVFLE